MKIQTSPPTPPSTPVVNNEGISKVETFRPKGHDSKESTRLERIVDSESGWETSIKKVAKAIPTYIMSYFKLF